MFRHPVSNSTYRLTYNARPVQEADRWPYDGQPRSGQISRMSMSGDAISWDYMDDANGYSRQTLTMQNPNTAGPIGGTPQSLKAKVFQETARGEQFQEEPTSQIRVSRWPEESVEQVVWLSRQPWMDIPQALFVEWATNDKERSLALQMFIERCPPEILSIVGELSLQNIEFLVVHRQGSYVVQKIISRSPLFRKCIGISMTMEFEEYVQNEFSSRVLEKLAALSRNFRNLTIKLFCKDWEQLIRNLPAVMFLCGCIKDVSEEANIGMIKGHLLANQDLLFTSKRYKKVLMVFVEVCNSRDLHSMFLGMMKQKTFIEILNDKLLVYVVIVMIRRGLPQAINLLMEGLWHRMPVLLDCKYFKQLFLDLIPEDQKTTRNNFNDQLKRVLNLNRECQTRNLKVSENGYTDLVYICSKTIDQFNNNPKFNTFRPQLTTIKRYPSHQLPTQSWQSLDNRHWSSGPIHL